MSTDTPLEQRMLEVAREFLDEFETGFTGMPPEPYGPIRLDLQQKLAALLTEEVKAARLEALEQAARKCEEWVLEFKHSPEVCDPCELGQTKAMQIRELEAK